MRKVMMIMLALMLSVVASAQNAEKLYKEGKELYDAKKYSAAVPKLKAAAEKGHKKAQYRLGLCYDKGKGVTENDDLAFQWYSKSAAQDYAKGQYQLGMCYKNGEGVKEDRKKAFDLFMKAAKQENGDAQYQLGKAYLKGKGVAADEAKAKIWLKRAVKNEKDGDDIMKKIKKDAAEGDKDAIKIMDLLKK
jgi:hypothetical protein